ncbi:hypothetical protein ACFL5V_09355 [Fibrobacterota bacterium]
MGTQAPCIYLYGLLLPGITNVTDRARYYSFYPWFLWASEKEGISKTRDELITYFRRADCLFTMIGKRHAMVSQEPEELLDRHYGTTVGIDTLRNEVHNLKDNGFLTLSKYATTDPVSERYFMNKFGGLGQYYRGTLNELNILSQVKNDIYGVTDEIGVKIAEAMDKSIDRQLFFKTILEDKVTTSRLDSLNVFCNCQLHKFNEEAQGLVNIFFNADGSYDQNYQQRRESLGLILHLATELEKLQQPLDVPTFRKCVYTGTLPNKKNWDIPDVLSDTYKKWEVYQRNDILSFALQSIIFPALHELADMGLNVSGSSEFAQRFCGIPEVNAAISNYPNGTIQDLISKTQNEIPELSDFESNAHEFQMMDECRSLYRTGKAGRLKTFELAIKLLLTLAARRAMNFQYRDIEFPTGYLQQYPINLKSFKNILENHWNALTISQLIPWILIHWGVEVHLKIALKKLSSQPSKSTFLVLPSEQGLTIPHPDSLPRPVYTNPRIKQAIQILDDIGCLERGVGKKYKVTPLGQQRLKEVCNA